MLMLARQPFYEDMTPRANAERMAASRYRHLSPNAAGMLEQHAVY